MGGDKLQRIIARKLRNLIEEIHQERLTVMKVKASLLTSKCKIVEKLSCRSKEIKTASFSKTV